MQSWLKQHLCGLLPPMVTVIVHPSPAPLLYLPF
jgi:hypothetical protein